MKKTYFQCVVCISWLLSSVSGSRRNTATLLWTHPLVPLDTLPASHEKCGSFTKQYCFLETHCKQAIAVGHVKKKCVISLHSNDVRHKSADCLSETGSKPLIHWDFIEFGWPSIVIARPLQSSRAAEEQDLHFSLLTLVPSILSFIFLALKVAAK